MTANYAWQVVGVIAVMAAGAFVVLRIALSRFDRETLRQETLGQEREAAARRTPDLHPR